MSFPSALQTLWLFLWIDIENRKQAKIQIKKAQKGQEKLSKLRLRK